MNKISVEYAYRMGGGLNLATGVYTPEQMREAARVLRRNTRTHSGDYRLVYLATAERLELAATEQEEAEATEDACDDGTADCPACGHDNEPMGTFGSRVHYRCRACGVVYSEVNQ